jgi:hypothetical protein
MKEIFKEIIDDPDKLERLYREDKKSFESDFREIYPEIQNTEAAKIWKSRLDFEIFSDKPKKLFGTDFYIMIGVCLFAGILIKIPELFNFNALSYNYYEKETGIIFFLGLTLYTILGNKNFSRKNLYITLLIFIISALYINLLPYQAGSATIKLVFIHMPFLTWCLYGFVYADFELHNYNKRIDFIRHNGDLAVLGGLIILAGGVLMAITIALFEAIGIPAGKFYFEYIVQIGFVSAPVVASYVLKNYSILTNKIAPVIANLFSPLVMVTLIIYLTAMAITGKDPYNDREFLFIFNIMLIGVMALIVFSISETSMIRKQRINELVLFILSIVTIIVNLVALSAIFYRLNEFGFSPNRSAILGSNILVFVNLILITIDLYKINFRKAEIERVDLTISKYIPVYLIWVLIVIFLFPFVFGMR